MPVLSGPDFRPAAPQETGARELAELRGMVDRVPVRRDRLRAVQPGQRLEAAQSNIRKYFLLQDGNSDDDGDAALVECAAAG